MKQISFKISLSIFVVVGWSVRAQNLVKCVPEPPSTSTAPGNGFPAPFPDGTSCYDGRDSNGAYYFMAIPPDWNGKLIVLPHGGPDQSYHAPAPVNFVALNPAIAQVRQGYAAAATSFSRNGWAVGTNALDLENLRQIFVKKFGRPKRTFVAGGSYAGGLVGLVVERYGFDSEGTRNYDGAAIGCGILGGLNRYFYSRIDQRVVYQYYCQNYPRPEEGQYPLYLGVPPGTNFDDAPGPADIQQRVQECTGIGLPEEERTDEQRRRLANILNVLHMQEFNFAAELALPATEGLRDTVQITLGGLNPVPNNRVRYAGSDDDVALNRGVLRYHADPLAATWLENDSTPTGRIEIPVETFHTIGDPIVYVEHESVFRDAVERVHRQDNLVQWFVDSEGHCEFSPSENATSYDLLFQWVDTGVKPTPEDALTLCQQHLAESKVPDDACRIMPAYRPPPFETRVYPRH